MCFFARIALKAFGGRIFINKKTLSLGKGFFGYFFE
jgi:hypothetical protein